jgi:hypothetical protein
MTREKYFTLSQALSEKLKEALKKITSTLQREIEEHLKPIELMHKEYNEFVASADTIRKAVEKEIALVEIERKAVLKFLDEQSQQGESTLQNALAMSLNSLFTNSSGVLKSVDNLTSALNKIVLQTLSILRVSTIHRVNRPYRKAIQVHMRELTKIRQAVVECIGENSDMVLPSTQEKLEASEIEADDNYTFPRSISPEDIISEWTDWFQNRQTRIGRIRNSLERLANEMITMNKRESSIDLSLKYKNSFERMKTILRDGYNELLKSVDDATAKKEESLNNRKRDSEAPVAALRCHIDAIGKIVMMLK